MKDLLTFILKGITGKKDLDIVEETEGDRTHFLIKAPEDLLVKHGLIEADDGSVVRSVSAKWNHEVEGVRVTIEPLFNRVPEAMESVEV